MTTYYQEPRPARKIPTREQLAAAEARRRAYQQVLQESNPSYSGHSAGLHPEDQPYSTDDYDLEEDPSYYQTRLPTSARRYQDAPINARGGKVNVVEHYHDQPLRAHRQQLPQPRQRYIEMDEVVTPIAEARSQKRNSHPFLYLGVGMIAMLALVVLVFSGWNWLQIKKDDLTYGNPRTSQTDFVVGHNDSPANPSHFIALNLNRHVQVIEIPGQDTTKERTFPITTLLVTGRISPLSRSHLEM